MGREDSPYIVGDYWLDQRKDGRSPGIWQIASYNGATRSVDYRSARTKNLDDAKAIIHAHVEQRRALAPQKPEDAKVIPILFTYWDEHGKKADSAGQIASSIRQFIGFLMQDSAGINVTVADLRKAVWERFREWRMGPHDYSVPWAGKTYAHRSHGVRGESVQRNLDDLRAALNHHADNARIPYAPKVPSVRGEFRSKPRDRVLTIAELGMIIGWCAYSLPTLRWVLLMLGTGARPEAALAMLPVDQFDRQNNLLDLHPRGWPVTKKVNPVVPVIPQLAPWLAAWAEFPHKPVKSRKVAWRTMRRALGLGPEVVPKTIRHTVATYLRRYGVPADEIGSLLGHKVMRGSTAVYAKYDPAYLAKTKEGLSRLWDESCRAGHAWLAGHLRDKRGNRESFALDKCAGKAHII